MELCWGCLIHQTQAEDQSYLFLLLSLSSLNEVVMVEDVWSQVVGMVEDVWSLVGQAASEEAEV